MFSRNIAKRLTFIVLLLCLNLVTACSSCDDDDDDNDDDDNNESPEPQDDDASPNDDDDDLIDDDAGDDDLIDDDTGDDDDDDAVEETEVDVPADQSDPVDSGVEVQTDQPFTIEATDSITLGPGGDPIGPEGNGQTCGADCTLPTAPRGALIARVEGVKTKGDWFLAGAIYAGAAPNAGNLQLLVNDDNYEDNSGNFNVTVTINCDEIAPTADDATGVFVSKDDGSDQNDCTAAAPCATISRGIARANTIGKPHVFIALSAAPPYAEAADIETDVSLYGGYLYDGLETWTRDLNAGLTAIANTVSVTGPDNSGGQEVALVLEGLLIEEPANKTGKAFDSAVEVAQKAFVTIVHCRLIGGTDGNNSYAVYLRGGRVSILDTSMMGNNGGLSMKSLTDSDIPAYGTLLNSRIDEPENAKADFFAIDLADESSLVADNNVIHVKGGNAAVRLSAIGNSGIPSLSMVNNLLDGSVILGGNGRVTLLANSYIRGIDVDDVSSLVIEYNAQIDILDDRSSCLYVKDVVDYLRNNNFWSVSPGYHLLEFNGGLYTDWPDINDCVSWQSPGFCSETGGNTNDEVTKR